MSADLSTRRRFAVETSPGANAPSEITRSRDKAKPPGGQMQRAPGFGHAERVRPIDVFAAHHAKQRQRIGMTRAEGVPAVPAHHTLPLVVQIPERLHERAVAPCLHARIMLAITEPGLVPKLMRDLSQPQRLQPRAPKTSRCTHGLAVDVAPCTLPIRWTAPGSHGRKAQI